MGKHIVYKNHCTPQEQRIIGGRYYLDSDANRKLTGSHSFELGSSSVGTGTLTSSGVLLMAFGLDFISVKVTSGDDVTLSLDGGTTQIIKLKNGECFSSKIAVGAEPYVTITGTSTVEYLVGT